ncbi:MAG: NGG1p interacting factor NIF3 [Firmicutes bacterium]|nr:NGG1p interacting factor NIF3 [Bacillota bacterium]
MKIREIYDLAIKLGIQKDPRDADFVTSLINKENKKAAGLSEEERCEYDFERLFNPYHDTRVLFGDPEQEVNTVLAGIDVEVEEILLADHLNSKGSKIDLVIAHHPEGKALANLYEVMHSQEALMAKHGVPVNVAEGIMAERIEEVKRGLLPQNHNRAVDAARILNLPFMCVHSAADNHVSSYLQSLIEEKGPETLNDILKLLKSIPEYQGATANAAPPAIFAGNEKNRAGKVLVMMAGGTSGSELIYEKLALAGVGTVLVMHIPEKNREAAEKNHVNVIVAGHMASDSLGMNLFLDELEKRRVKVLTCSGLVRCKRFTNSKQEN